MRWRTPIVARFTGVMIPAHWTPYRRVGNCELIGYVAVDDDGTPLTVAVPAVGMRPA